MGAQIIMNRTFLRNIATQGAVGYGKAPGTIATVMMMPCVWFLSSLHLPLVTYLTIATSLFLCAWWIVSHVLPLFDDSDPSEIVLDEMVSFIFVFADVPCNLMSLMIGFIVFRLLDIYKPIGVGYFDRLYGVSGVMLDDLAAALVTNACLHGLYYLHWL
jgi:phosphatidylglycerophosphatase A